MKRTKQPYNFTKASEKPITQEEMDLEMHTRMEELRMKHAHEQPLFSLPRAITYHNNPDEALKDAAKDGDLHDVKRYFQRCDEFSKAHPGSAGKMAEAKTNAFCVAATNGHAEVVRFLLDKGVSADALEKLLYGRPAFIPALYKAARHGHLSVVKVLIEYGANLTLKASDGHSPIDVADMYGHTEVVECLKQEALKRDAFFNAVHDGNADVVEDYLKTHHVKAINHMVCDKYKDVGRRDHDGYHALSIAACRGHLPIVQQLLAAGVSIDQVDRHKMTALCWAAEYGHLPVVRELINHDASLGDPFNEHEGNAAINIARNETHELKVDIAEHITSFLRKTGVLRAANDGNLQQLQFYLDRYNDNNGRWKQFDQEVLNIMNATAPETQKTALMLAACHGHLSSVKELLDAKASIDEVDSNGNTALMLAASTGDVNIVRTLLDAHASVKMVNQDGDTVLHKAASTGSLPLVYRLKDAADVSLKNNLLLTAADIAKANGHQDIANLLERNAKNIIKNSNPAPIKLFDPKPEPASHVSASNLIKQIISSF